jgi:amino acid transporter
MSTLKIILIAIAAVLGTFLALAAIGMIIMALQSLFWLSVLCLVAVGAVKLLKKPSAKRLEGKEPINALKNAEHALEEYKRRYPAK